MKNRIEKFISIISRIKEAIVIACGFRFYAIYVNHTKNIYVVQHSIYKSTGFLLRIRNHHVIKISKIDHRT